LGLVVVQVTDGERVADRAEVSGIATQPSVLASALAHIGWSCISRACIGFSTCLTFGAMAFGGSMMIATIRHKVVEERAR
jgi:hypothetical protein